MYTNNKCDKTYKYYKIEVSEILNIHDFKAVTLKTPMSLIMFISQSKPNKNHIKTENRNSITPIRQTETTPH